MDNLWTYFLGSQTAGPQGGDILGWGGGALAFFLAMGGAYEAGVSVIQSVEASFFAFLEDFQDNDAYLDFLDKDSDAGKEFHKFMR